MKGTREKTLKGISTDTRLIEPGCCFVALVGDRHDAHDFIPDALAKGASAILASRPLSELQIPSDADIAVVQAPDTLFALGELARYWRSLHSIPIVGITGSNGKTSTKEMVASILGQNLHVLKNQGNFNNLIGAPLTLLKLNAAHQAAVIEMGINIPGEMERLAHICRPTAGLITNIHPAHLEGLESLDKVLEEKGKLWETLDGDDLAVVNHDDERLKAFAKTIKARKIAYSLGSSAADVQLVGNVEMEEGASSFHLRFGEKVVPVRIPVLGLHQVQNAAAAAAAAWGIGVEPEVIAAGLSNHQPVRQRMQMRPFNDGCVLVDDTYNANPSSMTAAVRAIMAASGSRPVAAVLGEMRELGPQSASLHREVGEQIAALGVSRLATMGEMGRELSAAARDAGMSPSHIHHALTHEEATAWLLEHLPQKAWVLVKGSRSMTMERVVEGILQNFG